MCGGLICTRFIRTYVYNLAMHHKSHSLHIHSSIACDRVIHKSVDSFLHVTELCAKMVDFFSLQLSRIPDFNLLLHVTELPTMPT